MSAHQQIWCVVRVRRSGTIQSVGQSCCEWTKLKGCTEFMWFGWICVNCCMLLQQPIFLEASKNNLDCFHSQESHFTVRASIRTSSSSCEKKIQGFGSRPNLRKERWVHWKNVGEVSCNYYCAWDDDLHTKISNPTKRSESTHCGVFSLSFLLKRHDCICN